MGVELEEDLKRKMVELNLNTATLAQSEQTGFVHLNYDDIQRSDTIPLLENFSFVLALFRSRLAENVLEGKTLLEKLLAFEVDGNFPVYLHEFPQCKDRDFSLEILPVFHWLLFSFRTALGDALIIRLEMLIGRILSHGYKMHKQRSLCISLEFRLKSYFEPQNVPHWIPSSPKDWSSALISYQMALSLKNTTMPYLDMAIQKWHPQLAVYIGSQEHDRAEPKVTLLDLFMGHYFGIYSQRSLENQRTSLLAALIQPFDEKEAAATQPIPCRTIDLKASHPYVLYWGSPEKLNSFVIDPQNATCAIADIGDGTEITVSFSPASIPDGQDAIELSFFSNLSPTLDININTGKATTFQLGDMIELNSDTLKLKLQIVLEKGDGRFFGHILRANRPTQKGKNLKYETYDWRIALRTIRRSDDCVLKVKLDHS